jgi:cytochrome c5
MGKWIFTGFCMAAAVLLFQCAAKKTQTAQRFVEPAVNRNAVEPEPFLTPEEIAADKERKMLAAAESVEQGATSDWLMQGKEIMNNQCGSCHKAKDPVKYDEASWVRHMSRMVPKAKLSDEQAKFLRVYTIALIRTKK